MVRTLLIPILGLALIISHATAQIPRRTSITRSVVQYELTARVLPDARRLEINGVMRLPGINTPRAQLQLSLSELMHDFAVEVLEPSVSAGTARLERVDASGKNVKWTINPPRPLPAGQAVLLRFSYGGGERIANQFYIGPEVSFASAYGTDWYPLLIGGDDKAVGSIKFSVPAGQTVIAGGIRRSTPEEEHQGSFRFETIHPTYFSFAAGRYTLTRRAGAIPVSAYLLRSRPHIESYLEGVQSILTVLVREFGDYPFDDLSLVEVPRELANHAGFNAASVQGFVLTNSRAFDVPKVDYLLEWLGHEFGHQWFPHKVALQTPPGRYMEEALAEYGGLRVVEALAGAPAAERLRRTGYEFDPIFSALFYFKLVGTGFDHPLADLPSKPEYRNLAYNKGFLVFDMLSREIGRVKFQRIMHHLTLRNAFRSITWREFLRAIEVGAGRSLDWFYEQWFERTGAPEWQLSWEQAGSRVRGTITQAAPYYWATLEIEIRGGETQSLMHTVTVRGARTEFTVPATFRVQSVTLDPHYLVLRWTPEYRAAADAVRPR